MFFRVVAGSLRHRRSRLVLAALAVLLGAALVSGLVNLSFDTRRKAGRELLAYGAGILVLPGRQQTLREADLAVLEQFEEVAGYIPYLYLAAEVEGQAVVVAGTDFRRAGILSPWWKVEGHWPSGPGEGLLGAEVARALSVAIGRSLTVGYGSESLPLTVAGILTTGGGEENQVFVTLPAAQGLSGRPGEVGLAQVTAVPGRRPPGEVVALLQRLLPGAVVQSVRQFAQTQEAVLQKIRLLLAMVAALVLIVAALTVGSTLQAALLERRGEIGLMKALGASRRRIASLFLTEGAMVGVAAGAAGYAAGLAVAALIGRAVFQAALLPDPWGLPVTLAVALGVTLAASLWSVRGALAIDPAVTLRGE